MLHAKGLSVMSDEKNRNESELKPLVNVKAAQNDAGLMVCL